MKHEIQIFQNGCPARIILFDGIPGKFYETIFLSKLFYLEIVFSYSPHYSNCLGRLLLVKLYVSIVFISKREFKQFSNKCSVEMNTLKIKCSLYCFLMVFFVWIVRILLSGPQTIFLVQFKYINDQKYFMVFRFVVFVLLARLDAKANFNR